MIIFDESGAKVESPDLEKGRIEQKSRKVTHRWVVDVEEQTHEEVIAEYPETGGKDVAIIVDVEERGHWETRIESGEAVEFGGIIPEDMPKEHEAEDVDEYLLYIPYTKEELEEIAEKNAEAEAAKEKAEKQAAFLDAAPDRLDAVEVAQDDIILALADVFGGAF